MKLSLRKRKPDYSEITAYVNDIETLSVMRDTAARQHHTTEATQHSHTIHIMQEVLTRLLEHP